MGEGGYKRLEGVEVPDRDARIWRYMDFAKLVDMLDRQALFFARSDRMDDPWEGFSGGATLKRTIEWARAAGISEAHIELMQSSEPGSQLKKRASMMLSCWYLDEEQSAAMWDRARREGRGIAIRSTFGRLEDCLPGGGYDYAIFAGKVRYIEHTTDVIGGAGGWFAPFLHKRRSFEHERELRAFMFAPYLPSERGGVRMMPEESMYAHGVRVPVDLGGLVEQIFVAPWEQDWFAELVERTIVRYGLADGLVEHSNLFDDPVY